MKIINVNENYGDVVEFDSVQEMATAIVACGYTVPENGLTEGKDYQIVPESFSMLNDPSGSFYTFDDMLDQVRECPEFSDPEKVAFIGDQGTEYTGQELLDLVGLENHIE